MPRKPAPPARSSASSGRGHADAKRAPTIAALRTEIDRLDKELVSVLNRRAQVAAQIGQVKERDGIDVWVAVP